MAEAHTLNPRRVVTVNLGLGPSVRLRANRTEEETREQLRRIENYPNKYYGRTFRRYSNVRSAMSRAVAGMRRWGRWTENE